MKICMSSRADVKHYNESEATSQRRPSTRDQSLSRSGLLNVCLDESKVRNSRVSFGGNNNSKMGCPPEEGRKYQRVMV